MAVVEDEDAYRVDPERCIGCGLCIGTGPAGAVHLVHRDPDRTLLPPESEEAWFEERGRRRGVDFSKYR